MQKMMFSVGLTFLLFLSMFSTVKVEAQAPGWTIKSIAGYSWATKGSSAKNDTVIVCFGSGTLYYDHVTHISRMVLWPSFDDQPKYEFLTPYSTVITNYAYLWFSNTTATYGGVNEIQNLTDVLVTQYSKVFLFGFGFGSLAIAKQLIYGNTSTSVDKVLLSEGPLDYNFTCWSYSDPAVDYLALNASKVKIPTCLMVGVNTVDWGNYTDQNEHFYGNLTVTKEFHYFTDTAYLNHPPSIDVDYEVNAEAIVSRYFGLEKSSTQIINDFTLDHTDAWENFTTGLDPDALALINNGSDSCFTAYCKRIGADDWGDCIARQGLCPHQDFYCRDWDNKLVKPMLHYPYIPSDIEDNQILLETSCWHSEPYYEFGNWPNIDDSPWPTLGGTIMLYCNLYAKDLVNGGYGWLFNPSEPNPWCGPNMFLLEIFLTRWIVPYPTGFGFVSCPPGFFAFERFTSRTTHDNDLHRLSLPFEMPENDVWYNFTYDLAPKLREAKNDIEMWSLDHYSGKKTYEILGFQVFAIALGVESIGGIWTFKFGHVSLTDNRWGEKQACYADRTRLTGNRPIHNASWGNIRSMRPYMKYDESALEADITGCYSIPDEFVDYRDLGRIASKYGSTVYKAPYGDPFWDYNVDIVPDEIIDMRDVNLGASHYGQSGSYLTDSLVIHVWMVEQCIDNSTGIPEYLPDPLRGFSPEPRWKPYAWNFYMYNWDAIDWSPFYVGTMCKPSHAIFGDGIHGYLLYLYYYEDPLA